MSGFDTDSQNSLTFGEHLEALRKALIRVCVAVCVFTVLVFCFKEWVFGFLMAPLHPDFVLYGWLRHGAAIFGSQLPDAFSTDIGLISTGISSQLMAHLSASFYIGVMLSSPLVLVELLKYITPALYAHERRYASRLTGAVYLMFMLGIVVTYLLLFPISCRFLASYSVSPEVRTMISIDSYMSLFISLTVTMGLVFQLPAVLYFLSRIGVIDSALLTRRRKVALVCIMICAAIITPPDIFTLVIITVPLYALYELGILLVKHVERKHSKLSATYI